MATTTRTKAGKATTDSKGNDLHLQVVEVRDHGYFHLRARVCTRKYETQETSGWVPYGCDDDYSDGLLWSGLQVSCQGDERSQLRASGTGESGPVYGFDTEYASDYHRIDLRRVARMHKTLELVERKLAKLQEARGYVRSYGEYLGRVAEVLGCAGMVFEYDKAVRSGARYRWTTVGEGVNEANHRIYLWQQEAVARGQQLQAPQTTEVAS